MKHRGLIRLLSILAALLLPLSAMAQGAADDLLSQAKKDGKEIVTTVTFEPGQTLAVDKAVADLSAAAVLRFNKLPGGFGAFTLVLQGVDSFTAQFRALSDGLTVKSDILGTKPVYIAWADMQKFMAESMKSNGAGMQSFNQGFMGGLEGMFANKALTEDDTKVLTEAEMKQKIVESMGGDDSLVKWVETIEARAVKTTGSFTQDGSDTADTQTVLAITNDDISAMYDVAYIQKQMAQSYKAQDNTLTDAQADEKVKKDVATIKDAVVKSGAKVDITLLTAGEDLVGMTVSATGAYEKSEINPVTNTDGTSTVATTTTYEPVSFAMTYAAKTVENGKTHSFTVTGADKDVKKFAANGSLTLTDKTATGTLTVTDEADKPKLLLDLACDFSDAKHTVGELALTAYDTTNTAILFGYDQTVGETAIDTKLSVYTGTDITAIKADSVKSLLGTLKVNIAVQADSGTFAALKEATPETSLAIAKLSEAEMQTYLGSLQSGAMQAFYKILGNLPASVTSLLMGTSGT